MRRTHQDQDVLCQPYLNQEMFTNMGNASSYSVAYKKFLFAQVLIYVPTSKWNMLKQNIINIENL